MECLSQNNSGRFKELTWTPSRAAAKEKVFFLSLFLVFFTSASIKLYTHTCTSECIFWLGCLLKQNVGVWKNPESAVWQARLRYSLFRCPLCVVSAVAFQRIVVSGTCPGANQSWTTAHVCGKRPTTMRYSVAFHRPTSAVAFQVKWNSDYQPQVCHFGVRKFRRSKIWNVFWYATR